MSRRYLKAEQWGDLIALQAASSESVAEFCQRHGLTTKSFYRRRKALRELDQGKGLVEVAPPAVSAATTTHLTLTWHGVELAVASPVSPGWVAGVMRELANASV